MPGIVGMISQRPRGECEHLVNLMADSMKHEQFYTSGTYAVPEMGVYSGWVALKGSFPANQVFLSERDDVALVLAGECFADSPIPLLSFYEQERDQFFRKLNGLFGGLLTDRRQRKVFLFNDRYGMERIYWHNRSDSLYFASEAKALLRVLPDLREFDPEAVAQFITFGSTLKTRTLFRDIQLMAPGSVWCFEGGVWKKQKYFSPEAWESQTPLAADDFEQEFEGTFKRILPRYFKTDGRIGISLTAGLDCRMIMACRPQTSKSPICYTFSGLKRDTLDARIAQRVAKSSGLDHRVLRVGEDFFSDFASHVDRTVYITDGTLGALGAHEIYFGRQARALSIVRLTGVFGGEVLRGVSFLKPLELAPRLLNPNFASAVRIVAREGGGDNQNPVTVAAFRDIPEKRFGRPAASRSQLTFRTPYLDNELVALAYRLPAVMRKSSSAALHVVRANNSLLADIPTDRGLSDRNKSLTSLLRGAFYEATFKLDYRYNEGLPHRLSPLDPLLRQLDSGLGILGLHKFLNYRSWFQSELAPYVDDMIGGIQSHESPFWNSEFLRTVARDHTEGRKNYVLEINAVLTLEAITRLLFRNLPRDPNEGIIAIKSSHSANIAIGD